MRAVAYLRVSTDEQAESRLGLESQAHACTAWAAREGRALVGQFTDGVSGAAPLDKRPGLFDAIATLGPGDVLIVAKRDRLGRDPIVVAMIEAAVSRKNARIASAAGEGTDADDPTSILMRRMVDAFGEYERLIIKARTKSALAAKGRRGERTGQIAYGRRVIDDGRRSKAGLPAGLADDPVELAILDDVRELAKTGLSLRAIAAEMNRRGVRPKNGGASWSHSSVRNILKRTA